MKMCKGDILYAIQGGHLYVFEGLKISEGTVWAVPGSVIRVKDGSPVTLNGDATFAELSCDKVFPALEAVYAEAKTV